MQERIIKLLNAFGYPIYRQGSMSSTQEYPQAFFTTWNNDTREEAFYGGEARRRVWDYDINFYASDPELVDKIPEEAIARMKKEGFIIDRAGYDVMSDERTHTGRGIHILCIDDMKKEREDELNGNI